MEGKRDEIRKGPWKAEEDEVLINHVKKYGARDWSSIRAKGLLQRTGNGCKFSVEEERVVIELQAQFGNKWAKIATYLPGRTDNDVKNFWSSRQKRLARILQTSATPSSSSSSNSKPRKVKKEVPAFHDVPTLQVNKLDCLDLNSTSCFSMKEESSTKAQSCSSSYIETPEPASIVPLPFHSDLVVKNELPSYDANLAQVETQTQIPFPQISQHQPELTFSPESQELLARLEDPFLFNVFGAVDAPELGAQLSLGPPLFDPFSSCMNGAREVRSPTTRGTFFDDFPSDVFDNIEPLPSP
ncbi:hypothetical protein GH714_019083 [Hevea brasiliensis]|uniref:Uncharacterized protein n=1 Tax=Hevea brasiliensis TaxID=3981 RepID=A0A6A6LST5_HEVBR|nr:hypothetical protein GH714_019083 [Hevea brasiliensis]